MHACSCYRLSRAFSTNSLLLQGLNPALAIAKTKMMAQHALGGRIDTVPSLQGGTTGVLLGGKGRPAKEEGEGLRDTKGGVVHGR